MLASLLSRARGEGVLIFPAPARDTDPRGDMVWGVEGDLDLGRVLHVMLPRGESLLVMLPRGDSHGLENWPTNDPCLLDTALVSPPPWYPDDLLLVAGDSVLEQDYEAKLSNNKYRLFHLSWKLNLL